MNSKRTSRRTLTLETCEQRWLLTVMGLLPHESWASALDLARDTAQAEQRQPAITASATMASARQAALQGLGGGSLEPSPTSGSGTSIQAARRAALEQLDDIANAPPAGGVDVYAVELSRSGVGQVTPSVWESWTAQRNADAFVSRFFPMVDWSEYDTAATKMTGEFNVLQLSEIHSQAAWEVQDDGQATLAWPNGSIVFPTSAQRATHQVSEPAPTIPLVDIDQIAPPEAPDRTSPSDEIIRLNTGEPANDNLWQSYQDNNLSLEPSTPLLITDVAEPPTTTTLPPTLAPRIESDPISPALDATQGADADPRGPLTFDRAPRSFGNEADWGPLPQALQPRVFGDQTDPLLSDRDLGSRSFVQPDVDTDPFSERSYSLWQGPVDSGWGSAWQPEILALQDHAHVPDSLWPQGDVIPQASQENLFADWLESIGDFGTDGPSAASQPHRALTAADDEAVVSIAPELSADERWQLDATVTFFEHTPTLDQTVIPQQSEMTLGHTEGRDHRGDDQSDRERNVIIPRIAAVAADFVDVGHLPPPSERASGGGTRLSESDPRSGPESATQRREGGTYQSSRRLEIITTATTPLSGDEQPMVDAEEVPQAPFAVRVATPVMDAPVPSATKLTAVTPRHTYATRSEVAETTVDDEALMTQLDAGWESATSAESLLTSSQLFVIALGTGMYLRREAHVRRQGDRQPGEVRRRRRLDSLN